MRENNITDINLVIYHNQYLVATCKSAHLGFMGIFVKDLHLDYPLGTFLEIEFLGHAHGCTEGERIPMVVNHSETNGTGLRLKDFDRDDVNKWQDILHSITQPFVPAKRKVVIDALQY